MNVSERRVSFGCIQSAALKPFTSAAIFVGSTDASKCVIGSTPLTPFSRLSQAATTVLPTGETTPSPVTTTLRFDMVVSSGRARRRSGVAAGLLLDVALHVIDGLLDGGDLLGLLVGDLALELLLEGHHQLHVVERVRAQVLDEGRLGLDVGFGDAELLGDDLLDAGFNVVHRLPPSEFLVVGCAKKA